MSGPSQASTFVDVKRILSEIGELMESLKLVEAEIERFVKSVDHPVYGPPAKRTLAELYDQQVSMRRRIKALRKNAEGYQKALARGPASGRGSGRSSRASISSNSSKSSKSSKSSGSSQSSGPAENGWWCSCGALNYTNPDDQIPCWICLSQVFDEATCHWEFNPHPDVVSPWEIDMADPTANANPYGS